MFFSAFNVTPHKLFIGHGNNLIFGGISDIIQMLSFEDYN